MKFYTLLLIPLLFACSVDADPLTLNKEKAIIIEYGFNDSSVSPEYQRNYTITVSSSEVIVLVNSYGDSLADQAYPIEVSEFESLIETINNAALTSGKNIPEEPCDGGTSENLSINENSVVIYSGYFDHCAQDPHSMGNIDAVIDAIHELVPNLGELLE
jgi:hypothetical protein